MVTISFHLIINFGLTTLLIFLTIPMPLSKAISNVNYTVCSSPVSCGNITAGYPFWGDNRPEFCGQKEFNLGYHNGSLGSYTSINLDITGQYWVGVLSIDSSSHTMVVYQHHTLKTCLTYGTHVLPHVNPPFSLGEGVVNLSLFYGCSNSVVSQYRPLSFPCSYDSSGTNVSAYYFTETSEAIVDKMNKCNASVMVPVHKKYLDELKMNYGNNNGSALLGVLNKGFEVRYDANFSACSKCESSGGICGSSASMFACHCRDGEQPLTCPNYNTSSNFSACSKCESSGGVCGSSDYNYPSTFVCHCRDGEQPLMCPKSNKGLSKMKVILGSAVTVAGMMMLIISFFYVKKRSTIKVSILRMGKEITNENLEACLRICESLAPKRYTYSNLRKMTNHFKDKLGEGGYAIVYKGKLPNGRLVAVKLLKQASSDGEDFINEVASMGRTNHVNIVTLLGFCFERRKRALVYEFMPNGSLEKFTHCGDSRGSSSLSWEILFDISLGIARGLDYLHRGCNTRILHFDIKPHNILLDEEFRPKISDFGLARLCPQKESTISMLDARGTIGYIAPEVFCRNFGGISHKSDVYSYGMMVLDMACGRRNNWAKDEENSELYFPDWIYNRLELEEEVALHGIMNDKEKDLQRKMILVSMWCIQTYPANRPSISKVVEMLEGCPESIPMPPKPFLCSPPTLVFETSRTPIISL